MAYINYNLPAFIQNANNILSSTNDLFDVINGFGGIDTVVYSSAVNVDLFITGFQNTGGSNFDQLINIENLTGSSFNDTLSGNSGNNVLNGGAGIDTVSYLRATSFVVVDLSITGLQNTVSAGWDTLLNFENLTGSRFNDILKGNSGTNVLNGGAGIDTVSYDNAAGSVSVSLAIIGAQATGAAAGTDTLISFENLTGSNFNDRLTGNAVDNSLSGLNGDDFIFGTIGYDRIDGGAGRDTLNYQSLGESISFLDNGLIDKGASGQDRFANIETILASIGLGDTIDYSGIISAGSNTDLSAVTTFAPSGITYEVRFFENVIGTDLTDGIVGDQANNILSGGGGDDKLNGLAGSDALSGDKGKDHLTGGLGNDFLDGGLDKDFLFDNSGSDIFNFSQAADSTVASPDEITGFSLGLPSAGGDFIGLTMIDADTTNGPNDDGFVNGLIFGPTYGANSQLRWQMVGPNLMLYGNTNGVNTDDEFAIQINGIASIGLANILI